MLPTGANPRLTLERAAASGEDFLPSHLRDYRMTEESFTKVNKLNLSKVNWGEAVASVKSKVTTHIITIQAPHSQWRNKTSLELTRDLMSKQFTAFGAPQDVTLGYTIAGIFNAVIEFNDWAKDLGKKESARAFDYSEAQLLAELPLIDERLSAHYFGAFPANHRLDSISPSGNALVSNLHHFKETASSLVGLRVVLPHLFGPIHRH